MMESSWGDISCACGIEYRQDRSEKGQRFWPRTGTDEYRPEPAARGLCVRCGANLRVLSWVSPRSRANGARTRLEDAIKSLEQRVDQFEARLERTLQRLEAAPPGQPVAGE